MLYTDWKCSECAETYRVPAYNLSEIGNPVCPDCEEEMEAWPRKTITIIHDDHPESPCEWGTWNVVSFNDRHRNHTPPNTFIADEDDDDYVEDSSWNKELTDQLDRNEAFILSYSEHGMCTWSLSGEGSNCPWDSRRVAGILFLTDAKHVTNDGLEREKLARNFLKIYTQWCNGSVYLFHIEDDSADDTNVACGGFYDWEDMQAAILEDIKLGDNIVLKDESGFCENPDFFKLPVVTEPDDTEPDDTEPDDTEPDDTVAIGREITGPQQPLLSMVLEKTTKYHLPGWDKDGVFVCYKGLSNIINLDEEDDNYLCVDVYKERTEKGVVAFLEPRPLHEDDDATISIRRSVDDDEHEFEMDPDAYDLLERLVGVENDFYLEIFVGDNPQQLIRAEWTL